MTTLPRGWTKQKEGMYLNDVSKTDNNRLQVFKKDGGSSKPLYKMDKYERAPQGYKIVLFKEDTTETVEAEVDTKEDAISDAYDYMEENSGVINSKDRDSQSGAPEPDFDRVISNEVPEPVTVEKGGRGTLYNFELNGDHTIVIKEEGDSYVISGSYLRDYVKDNSDKAFQKVGKVEHESLGEAMYEDRGLPALKTDSRYVAASTVGNIYEDLLEDESVQEDIDESETDSELKKIIKRLDDGDGASQKEIESEFDGSREELENSINRILRNGEAYEPKPGYLSLL